MTKSKTAKIGASVVALAMAFSFSAPAQAVTVAELQAQINALMAQLASLQGGTVVATYQFNQNLTVGSTGAAVTSLQQFLVAKGYLVMPTGVAYGYFGPLTKAAVAKYQVANGISPAVGYFGPITRAHANASGTTTGTTTGGTVTGGATGSTGGTINTPGVEGVLSAKLAPTPGAGQTVREGDDMKKILGLELEADLSDIRIERIKVKLDASSPNNDRDFYRDIADRIYVLDGSTVVASSDLSSSTVIEESNGNYYVTLTGVNYIVRKDATKTLTLAIDAQSSFDSDFNGNTFTMTVPVDGVRGVDGAGVNQYAPSSALARSFTTQQASSETATLTLSKSTNSPMSGQYVADEGTDNDELDGIELLRFDLEAEDDDVTVTDLVATIERGGNTSTATTTTAYLYKGSSLVASATVDGNGAGTMTVTFDDIETTIDEDDTDTYSIKVDIVDAGTAATTFRASVAQSGITAENSMGDDVTVSGSATGEYQTIRSVGPEFTLQSKSINKSSYGTSNNSTSTAEAKFTVRVKAVGGDITLGTAASTTPFAANTNVSTPSFTIYRNGGAVTLDVASSSSVTAPAGYTVTSNSFTIQEGNSADVEISYIFEGRTSDGSNVALGSYAVGVSNLNWVSSATGATSSNYMDGDTAWRTSTVQLP